MLTGPAFGWVEHMRNTVVCQGKRILVAPPPTVCSGRLGHLLTLISAILINAHPRNMIQSMGTGISFQFSPDKSGCILSKAAQGFTPRRTFRTLQAKTRRERPSGEKGPFMDGD
jgi:hypothetical protein